MFCVKQLRYSGATLVHVGQNSIDLVSLQLNNLGTLLYARAKVMANKPLIIGHAGPIINTAQAAL